MQSLSFVRSAVTAAPAILYSRLSDPFLSALPAGHVLWSSDHHVALCWAGQQRFGSGSPRLDGKQQSWFDKGRVKGITADLADCSGPVCSLYEETSEFSC